MGKFTLNLFGFRKERTNVIDKMKEIPTPTITERDLRTCNCCVPQRRTIITGSDGYGMPIFLCQRSGIQYKYAHCRGQGTYIQSTGLLI